MSSYYPSFNYMGINSREKNFVVAHFEADNGQSETFLSMDSIYSESADGSSRLDYGAKYNSVAVFNITMIKQDGADFSVADVRDCLKWLTGSRRNSALDLTEHFIENSNDVDTSLVCDGTKKEFKLFHQCDHAYYVKINGTNANGWTISGDGNYLVFDTAPAKNSKIEIAYNRIKYSFFGRITNAWQQKMDARTVGIILEFTSSSPWAFSRVQTVEHTIHGREELTINNESDEQYSWLYMKTTYKNLDGTYLKITNKTTADGFNEEMTYVANLGYNETIVIDSNKMITSDKTSRIFGSDFNFHFPRLRSGLNTLEIECDGILKFEYIMPLKAGDCAMDISVLSDPVCNELGEIILDTLDWSRITGAPTSLGGYGITNAYTMAEVDTKIANATVKEISWNRITHKPTTLAGFFLDDEVYNKTQIDEKFTQTDKNIAQANEKIKEVGNNLIQNYFNKTQIQENYYNKKKIDDIVSQITYDPETGTGAQILWAQIIDKPEDLAGYGIKMEVQEMISASIGDFSIDEDEFNAMLKEVLT